MRTVLTAVTLIAFVGASCTPDPPSHDKAVAVIAALCAEKTEEMDSLGLPTDVFALSKVAGNAFDMASRGLAQLDSEGLAAMDDDASIQAYLRDATAMNNALSALGNAAGFEDVSGMDAALVEADAASADLDAAVADLGLDPSCGGPAWRGRVLDDARTVVGLERGLMAPSGDYVADVTTYCSRYERRVDLAAQPGNPDDARRRAFVIRSAAQQFGSRLGLLTPPPELADTNATLVTALADLANLLEPADTLAIDADQAGLADLVARGDVVLGEIDAQLTLIGADC